jgi:ribose-phosphate pyrophosphokinase
VTVVVPHFGYARQDKKDKARAPITAKLVANLMQTSGIDRVITIDLHASQIQGFFDIPVDNLYGEPIFARYVREHLRPYMASKQLVVVSPDAGGVKRAKSFSDVLHSHLAIIHKERKRANEVEGMTLVGSVQDMVVLIVDDMVDTCGTVVKAAETCMEGGAIEVWAVATHGVLSDPAVDRIRSCAAIKGVIITNTIPQEREKLAQGGGKIVTLDISTLLAEAIRRTHNGESISALFGPSFATESTIVE